MRSDGGDVGEEYEDQHCEKSPLWRLTGVYKSGKSAHTMKSKDRNRSASTGRAVASFEYLGAD